MVWLRVVLTLLLLASLGTGVSLVLTPAVRPRSAVAEADRLPVPGTAISARVAESLTGVILEHAPFRADRTPGPTSAEPVDLQTDGPGSRPVLVLRAIAWGARPAAVIEGFPGVEGGRVVLAGDTVGGLRVAAIKRATVVIAGSDTTWTLHLEVPE